MSQAGRFREFVHRNLVVISMVPSLFLVHWGWLKLQDMEAFVRKDEKKDLPLIEGARYIEGRLEEKFQSWRKKEE